MASLLHKFSKMHTSIIASASACRINSSNISPSHRAISQRPPTFETEKPTINAERKHNFASTIRKQSTLEIQPAQSQPRLTMSKDEINQHLAVYPDVVDELTSIADRYKCEDAVEWFRKALEYNLSLTNTKNGLITVLTYKNLATGDQLSPEKIRLAHLLGCCVEVLHCVLFITDDIVDNSTTRRGKPCWYTLEEVGLNSINDSLMIENGIYEFLKNHFRHLDCYVELLELFHENTFKCICGQSLDMIISRNNVLTFNMDTFNTIVYNKSSSNFFYLPVALGLSLAGVKDKKVYEECEAITFVLATFCQVQNDYLDSFGNPDFTGKIGTDIQTNKCSWLAVVCLEIANPAQRAIMEECYGKNDRQKTARIQELYEDLDMPRIYAKYEEETYNKLEIRINQVSNVGVRDTLLEVLRHVTLRGVK
ncbi:PREDICTED: farnesyl pyrophosphate synthase-like [Rhagoletis zephyria]|uniref:farnesyl pyrophosphate synthase-like n=1 Tax=Rhagoletis zephyria TaxID=28612 RepID=UPI0008119D9A|nr:PREDICTED: farnesyl pyrophosphate synthase-like [Rhagoletis zephyria]